MKRKGKRMKEEQIEKYLNSLKEAIREFKGGSYFKIRVIGHLNVKCMTPFDVQADYDVNDDLKAQSAAPPDAEIYPKPFDRIIRKGDVSTAWQRGSTTVIALYGEHLIVNETLNAFCTRIGWEL